MHARFINVGQWGKYQPLVSFLTLSSASLTSCRNFCHRHCMTLNILSFSSCMSLSLSSITKDTPDRSSSSSDQLIEAHLQPDRPDSGDHQEEGSFSPSSQGSEWPDWSGWWSEEVKRVSKFEEHDISTNLKHLQTPSENSTSVHQNDEENVIEQQQNMENDGDKQVSIHTTFRLSNVSHQSVVRGHGSHRKL